MGNSYYGLILHVLQIVWINLLLSGDNAVVIALACRNLDQRKQKLAIALAAGGAVLMRVILTIFVVRLLAIPYVQLLGGLLLFWVAIDLLRTSEEKTIDGADSIAKVVRTIIVADALMSLDNVVAIAAAADNSMPLIIFGIALSVPLIVFGSKLILGLLRRAPLLVVAGAAMLGWIAAAMIAEDHAVQRFLTSLPDVVGQLVGPAGACLVLFVAGLSWLFRRRTRSRERPVAI